MNKSEILVRKFPGTEWVLRGDELEWLSDAPAPTEVELEALWPEVEAEMAAERKAKEDARLSGLAKLEALGLTVEEVSTVFGIEV